MLCGSSVFKNYSGVASAPIPSEFRWQSFGLKKRFAFTAFGLFNDLPEFYKWDMNYPSPWVHDAEVDWHTDFAPFLPKFWPDSRTENSCRIMLFNFKLKARSRLNSVKEWSSIRYSGLECAKLIQYFRPWLEPNLYLSLLADTLPP